MPFLEIDDYRFSIKIPMLMALVDNDDSIVHELTNEAVNDMTSYLNARYRADELFEKTGDARDKTLMMYCRDIALFHIFSIYNFRVIPAIRETRYKKALLWLQEVSQQKINPEGFPINDKSFVKSGTNDKRINQQL